MAGAGPEHDEVELRVTWRGRLRTNATRRPAIDHESSPADEHATALTRPERRLRLLLICHAIVSGLLALAYIADGKTAVVTALPNSFAKDMLFVGLSVLAAGDLRRRGWLSLVIAFGYLALVLGEIATLVWGGAPDQDLMLFEVSGTVALFAWMAVDIVLVVLFVAWWSAAERAAKALRYLHPISFAALHALAEVLIEGRREVLSHEQVARNVDRYLDTLEAREKWRVQAALILVACWPMLTGRPPLPALAPETRKRFLERRFIAEKAWRRRLGPVRAPLRAAIRTASQMAYLGYYGDERTWRSIGYTRYRDRATAEPPPEPGPEPPLRSLPHPPPSGSRAYDVIVIGSGAAGGVLAYRFAQADRRVLVVERGPHMNPLDFTDDEVSQYLHLYNEGALQLATGFNLQVLQGMCVGGGTTINNGLCLHPPQAVLDAWAKDGIDGPALNKAIDEVRGLLGIGEIRADRFTEAAKRFEQAAKKLPLPGHLERMEANISQLCRGCGYCNIGCAFGAKHGTLDTVLPWAQHGSPGHLDLLADFEVERITHRGGGAQAVEGVHGTGRRATIAADKIVVAAGAISSSLLLQRSGLGGDQVGRGLHFNVNSPLTADFPDRVDSFDGIQMSHAYVADGEIPPYLVETWFNPPATQALTMPGWFDQHFENMGRYRHMACAGVLVGTTTPGRVKRSRVGRRFKYDLSSEDRDSMLDGLYVAGRTFLEARATRVMPATFTYREYRSVGDLENLRRDLGDDHDLLLTSAHPQGGNAMGKVVDDEFRVRNMENLYVCDASVFPSSVRVNPQLTVMGIAYYGAERICAR
jgi:choline dehydrogenase-like flavoprotein